MGDAYTDLTFAINRLEDSWYVLNSLYINDAMDAFVFDGDASRMKFHGGCGSDIQLTQPRAPSDCASTACRS